MEGKLDLETLRTLDVEALTKLHSEAMQTLAETDTDPIEHFADVFHYTRDVTVALNMAEEEQGRKKE